jgi:hypothetical protein
VSAGTGLPCKINNTFKELLSYCCYGYGVNNFRTGLHADLVASYVESKNKNLLNVIGTFFGLVGKSYVVL